MLRQPMSQPHMNGHSEYEGEVPEDDYSDFNAWGEDFDDHGDGDDYTEPDVTRDFPPQRNQPPIPGQGRMFSGASVPRPPPQRGNPSPRQPQPAPTAPNDDPPPIIPRGGRAPAPPPQSERSSDPPPTLPSRGLPAPPPPQSHEESDEDPSEEYLEPFTGPPPDDDELQEIDQTYLDPESAETYEDPNEVNDHIPHQQPPMRNQGRQLPPPPPPDDDMYQCPDDENMPPPPQDDNQEIYAEADDPPQLSTRKGPPMRQLPQPPPQQMQIQPKLPPLPRVPVPEIPVDNYEGEGETYEDPDEVVQHTQQGRPMPRPPMPLSNAIPSHMPPSHMAPSHVTQRSLPPEPGRPTQQQQPRQNSVKKPAASGPKMVDTISLRQKIGGLRPLDKVFDNSPQVTPTDDNNNDSDDDDSTVSNLGVMGMIKKLGKQNSMFKSGPKKDTSNYPPKKDISNYPTATAASRRLPDAPADYPSTQRLSDTSSHSAASDDNSSGSGSVIATRRPVDPLPPVPQPTPKPADRPPPQKIGRNIKVEDEYFYFEVDRTATDELLSVEGDGTFLVRPSKLGGPGAPYTMCVYYKKRVWNLKIRLRSDQRFALGTVHENEKTFASVYDMVTHHHSTSITLAGRETGHVLLKDSPPRDDIYDGTC